MASTAECHFGGGRETRNEHVGHRRMTFQRWPEATAEVFHSAVAVAATAETTFGRWPMCSFLVSRPPPKRHSAVAYLYPVWPPPT